MLNARSIKSRERLYKETFDNFVWSKPKHGLISSALKLRTDCIRTQERRPIKTENYRGIYSIVIGRQLTIHIHSYNNSLYDYATKKGILKDEQRGIRKMHGAVDSIFILKMLIDNVM